MRSVKEALVGCATTRIALLDSSKFHSRGLYTFCDFDALDILITVENEENAPLLEGIARHQWRLFWPSLFCFLLPFYCCAIKNDLL